MDICVRKETNIIFEFLTDLSPMESLQHRNKKNIRVHLEPRFRGGHSIWQLNHWPKISGLVFFSIAFFPLPFRPLYLPSNHHTVVHVHESFFLFAQSLHPVPFPLLAVILLSIYDSVSIFLGSGLKFLVCPYKKN